MNGLRVLRVAPCTLAAFLAFVPLARGAVIWSVEAFAQAQQVYQNEAIIVAVTITVDPLSPDPFDFGHDVGFGYPAGIPANWQQNYLSLGADFARLEMARNLLLQPGETHTINATGYFPKNALVAPGDYGFLFQVTGGPNGSRSSLLHWTVLEGLSNDPTTYEDMRQAIPEPGTLALMLLGLGFGTRRAVGAGRRG